MRWWQLVRPRCVVALLALLALLGVLPCAMAAATIDIAAAVGFSDTFQAGRWTPLIVTVTNHGSDLSGELEVQVTGGNELRGRAFVTTHRRTLDLNRAQRKSLQFTVFPQSLFYPVVIRVHSGGRELARTEIDLRTRSLSDERLFLVLSRDANLDYLNDRAGHGLRVLYPHQELLPVHWRGYDAVAAVAVHGISLERLSADQYEALRKWIAQGGILAVSGAAEYTLLRTSRLAALLPGIPQGITRMDSEVMRSTFAASLDLASPVHVHRLGAFVGHARLHAGETPLIVERTLGLGRVLYFAFDVARPPFDRWQGMRALWLEHLRLPPPPARALNAEIAVADGPLPALIRARSADFPSYVVTFVFLALYLGLLATGYWLPALGARHRALAVHWVWAAPALFALAAWTLFGPASFPRGPAVITMALIEPLPDSPYARLELDLGMYSNRSAPFRLEYRGAEPMLSARQAQRGGHLGDWVFGAGSRPYLEPRERRRYVLHALYGEDVIAFELKASIDDEPEGPRVIIDNASGRGLDDLRLVYDGYVYALGSLAAGVRSERRLSRRSHGVPVENPSWRGLLKSPAGIATTMLEPTRIVLERKAQAMGAGGYPGPGYALLAGYTASPLHPTGHSTNWSRRESALVAMQFAALPAAAATIGASDARPPRARAHNDPSSPRQPGAGAESSAAPRDK